MQEEWKPIEGYEGYYEVSNAGRVRSLDRIVPSGTNEIRLRGRMLVLHKNVKGYFFVNFRKDCKTKGLLVHRLVAAAFVPNPAEHPHVAHLDGNPGNNCATNLQWATPLINNNQKGHYHCTPMIIPLVAIPLVQTSEIWKPVVGYEGLYEVSDWGRIRSMDHYVKHRWGGQRLVRGTLRYTVFLGLYPGVHLSKNNSTKMHAVHKLVASAFLGPCPFGMQVAHWDGDPTNPKLKNLRYATPSDNNMDKQRHGTAQKGERSGTHRLTDEAVREIRKALAEGASKMSQARRFGVSHKTIRNLAAGKIWTHVV